MSGDRVRVGVVGLGRLGKRHAANLASRVPGAELVAACSPSVMLSFSSGRTLHSGWSGYSKPSMTSECIRSRSCGS